MRRLMLITTLAVIAGCGGTAEDPADKLPASVKPLAIGVVKGAGAAVAMGAPLAAETERLFKDQDTVTEAQARKRFEQAAAGIVMPGTCVSFTWSGGLTGTALFLDCKLALTGQAFSGGVIVTLKIKPKTQTRLEFIQLKQADDYQTGNLELDIGGGFKPVLTADLRTNSGSSTGPESRVVLQAATVSRTAGAAALSGQGNLKQDSLDLLFEASDLTWSDGKCRPTSGSLSYTPPGQQTRVVITFLAATPQSGKASVRVGQEQPLETQLFDPC